MKIKFIAVLAWALAASLFATCYGESAPNSKAGKIIVTNKPLRVSRDAKESIPKATPEPAPAEEKELAKNPPPVKPPLRLSIKQPLPTKYIEAPTSAAFGPVVNKDYHLSVPTAFGQDPLSNLPGAQGPMLVRFRDNLLFMAVNMVDPEDTASFNPTQSLPNFEGKRARMHWLMGTAGKLACQISTYDSVNGTAYIIEGKYEKEGRTYELLYSFPKEEMTTYLPSVLYSLNSFQTN